MQKRLFSSTSRREEENYIGIADLMAGLMVIFLFIAITYIRPIVKVQVEIREIENALWQSLEDEFADDLERWDAELDPEMLAVRFKAPDVLFDAASSTLKVEFREILSDFFPRYVLILYKYRDVIDEVRIEGHTSSEWMGVASVDDPYFLNMALSQERTRSVLRYCLRLRAIETWKIWARGIITANGLSSSQLITSYDGREDKIASRRVEFSIRTNAKDKIEAVLEAIR